jgi:hypothetical protein
MARPRPHQPYPATTKWHPLIRMFVALRIPSVVEKMLGERVVDRDDRELQDPVPVHLLETDHARRRFLGPAQDSPDLLLMHGRDQVRAVVDQDLGKTLDHVGHVLIVFVPGFTLDRVHAQALPGQGGRHVVLRGKRVRGGQKDPGAARGERPHQVGGLGRNVEAAADAAVPQWFFAGESLPDQPQHGHFGFRPFDSFESFRGQLDIFNAVFHRYPFPFKPVPCNLIPVTL